MKVKTSEEGKGGKKIGVAGGIKFNEAAPVIVKFMHRPNWMFFVLVKPGGNSIPLHVGFGCCLTDPLGSGILRLSLQWDSNREKKCQTCVHISKAPTFARS